MLSKPDISIDGRGFYTIRGESQDGREWLEDNVDGYLPMHGAAYCESTGYAQDIADGAADAGLSVVINGRLHDVAA